MESFQFRTWGFKHRWSKAKEIIKSNHELLPFYSILKASTTEVLRPTCPRNSFFHNFRPSSSSTTQSTSISSKAFTIWTKLGRFSGSGFQHEETKSSRDFGVSSGSCGLWRNLNDVIWDSNVIVRANSCFELFQTSNFWPRDSLGQQFINNVCKGVDVDLLVVGLV